MILAAVAVEYGEERRDEETGEVLGHRLSIDRALMQRGRKVCAEVDKAGNRYILGVVNPTEETEAETK